MRRMKPAIAAAVIGAGMWLAGGCSGAEGPQMAGDSDRGESLLVRALSELDKGRVTVKTSEAEIVTDGIVLPAVQPELLSSTWGRWSADYREAVKLVQLMDRSVEIQRPTAQLQATTLVVSLEQESWSRAVKETMEQRLTDLRRATELLADQQARVSAEKELGALEAAASSLTAEGICTIRLNLATGKPERLIMESRMVYGEAGGTRGETVRTIYDF